MNPIFTARKGRRDIDWSINVPGLGDVLTGNAANEHAAQKDAAAKLDALKKAIQQKPIGL